MNRGRGCERFLACAALLLIFVFPLCAQEPPLKFKPISFEQGLSQSPVTCMFQDRHGFIWMGNWKGLTRFDGSEFRNYQHIDTDSSTLSNNRVNSIFEDRQGKLWVATANGLNVFDRKTEKFSVVGLMNIKGGRNYISSVTADARQQIWVSTFAGVKLVDRQQLADLPSLRRGTDTDVAEGTTFTLFKDADDLMWVGTKHGPRRFNPVFQTLTDLPPSVRSNKELMQAKILVIRQDRYGNIWFGTENSGAFKYSPATGSCIAYRHREGDSRSLCSNWIKDILVSREGPVWIGTRGGLSILRRNGSMENYNHQASDPASMTDNTVWSLFQDRSRNVWIGTFAGGINFYYPGISNFINVGERNGSRPGLNHSLVNSVVEDESHNLWVGTYGGGINYMNLKNHTFQYYSIHPNEDEGPVNGVKSISQDPHGNLWIGTLDGLYRFNKATHAVKSFRFEVREGKLSANLINIVLADAQGVWAGTNGGGLRYIGYDGQSASYRHDPADPYSLSDNFVTALLKDPAGGLWVATQNGLNYYDLRKQRFTLCYRKRGAYSLNQNSILTLFIDSRERMWVGTEGGGLSYFDRHRARFYPVTTANGLPDNVVHAILEDGDGNIWGSTDNGLFKIRRPAIVQLLHPSHLKITIYNANNGLSSNQFSTNAALRTSSGRLLFGGVNGLTLFSPRFLLRNAYIPPVVLTSLEVRNRKVAPGQPQSPLQQSITETSSITLSYDQRFFTIRFAALNFVNSANNRYAFKLEGLTDKEDWHFAGDQQSATYTSLSPGEYVFKVRGANNDGVWNPEPATLRIRILPPLWMTWWAYVLYFLLLSAIVYAVVRFYTIRARLKRELFYEQVQNERQQELFQIKLNFFTNISHEIRTPLTLIIGPLEKLLSGVLESETVHRQLVQVKNNADRLMRLVTELLDFRKMETGHMKLRYTESNVVTFAREIWLSFQNLALSRRIEYRFVAEEDPITVCFDKDQMEKVLFNLLSNAFKFTPDGGTIGLQVKRNRRDDLEWADLVISDNGKGIPPESQDKVFNNFFQADSSRSHLGTGIGLALSKSIVGLHQGELSVSSVPAVGDIPGKTDFIVSLRLGKTHLPGPPVPAAPAVAASSGLYTVPSPPSALTPQSKMGGAAKKYTVLVIEDNEEVRHFISSSLADTYQVYESPDGLRGLDDAYSLIPDLIISDIMMPGIDGLELCRSVKADERTNHIPVILLTARAAYIHQVNGFETGADAYITKPFSIHLLELNVRNILATKDLLRKKYTREALLQPADTAVPSPEEKFLQKLLPFIEKNMENESFGVQDIVDEVGMSRSVLYKKVQALTGLSVGDYIKQVRLQKAAALLKQKKLGIAEVAFSVGYSDRKYFSKEFRRQFGLSPTEYISRENPEKLPEVPQKQ